MVARWKHVEQGHDLGLVIFCLGRCEWVDDVIIRLVCLLEKLGHDAPHRPTHADPFHNLSNPELTDSYIVFGLLLLNHANLWRDSSRCCGLGNTPCRHYASYSATLKHERQEPDKGTNSGPLMDTAAARFGAKQQTHHAAPTYLDPFYFFTAIRACLMSRSSQEKDQTDDNRAMIMKS